MSKKLTQAQNLKKEVKGMKRIISLCISLALVFSMVQALGVSAKTTQQLEESKVTRFSGSNRVNTALDISSDFETSDSVVLASGNGFADALAGVPLAGSLNAPLLLTTGKAIEPLVLEAIQKLKASNVYILGGESTIPAAVKSALEAKGLNVKRLFGGTRYGTAVAIATELAEINGSEPSHVVIADALNYPDALAAGAAAGKYGMPILFTPKNSAILNSETEAYIAGISEETKVAYIAGGTSSVPQAVENYLGKNLCDDVVRLAGSNRYETSVAICDEFYYNLSSISLAAGGNFPDALAGGAHAALKGSPLLLINNVSVVGSVRNIIQQTKPKDVYVYGGTSALSDKIIRWHILDKLPITIRSTFTPNDWMTALFSLAAEDSGVEYTNIAATGDERYKQAVNTAFLSGNDPDVLYYWMGADAEPFVSANKFVSIDEIKAEYPDFASDHDMNLIKATATASDGKQYFIPGPGYSEALFANKKVLAAAGVSLPDKNTTYEQWVANLKTIKTKGYIPLATVFDPAEGIHYLWEYTSYNNEKVASQHGSYTKDAAEAAAFAAGLDDIKALYTDGLLYNGVGGNANTATNGDAFDALLSDKAAFFVGGSWSYNVTNPNIAITYFPAKAGASRKSTDAIGDISMGFAISRNAWNDLAKRDSAVQFVQSITSAEALLSYGEWRTYTLSASAAANKNRAYVITDTDWLEAARISEGAIATPLTDTLKSSLAFNAGVTMFQGAVQDWISPSAKAILFGQSADFFNGNVTAAELIAAVNATYY
ncbi:MAG: cell wall-binding repeat-containing protein [Oscillospiraceae bacterium]|nr:cell wall-binding repeat-containing protein [Oscillospiraceae bacterium]